jgi:hypothetical protein
VVEQLAVNQLVVGSNPTCGAERNVFQETEALKVVHGSIQEIPKETIIDRGFVRIKTGKSRYILFKKILEGGAVIVR